MIDEDKFQGPGKRKERKDGLAKKRPNLERDPASKKKDSLKRTRGSLIDIPGR